MEIQDSMTPDGMGYLILHVTTAEGALQLEGAVAHISEYLPEGEGGGDHIVTLYSGADGNTPILPLKTKPRSQSLTAGNGTPYLVYTAQVSLEGYAPATYTGIPIFDGIVAIQPVNLIPLPESGTPLPETDENDRHFEMPENNL